MLSIFLYRPTVNLRSTGVKKPNIENGRVSSHGRSLLRSRFAIFQPLAVYSRQLT